MVLQQQQVVAREFLEEKTLRYLTPPLPDPSNMVPYLLLPVSIPSILMPHHSPKT
jgi:hypothetical protein